MTAGGGVKRKGEKRGKVSQGGEGREEEERRGGEAVVVSCLCLFPLYLDIISLFIKT